MKYYYIVFQEAEDEQNSFQWEVTDSMFTWTQEHDEAYIHTAVEITEDDYNQFFVSVVDMLGDENGDPIYADGFRPPVPMITFILDEDHNTTYVPFDNDQNKELLSYLNSFIGRKFYLEPDLGVCTSYKIDDIDLTNSDTSAEEKHETLKKLATHPNLPRNFYINRLVIEKEADVETHESSSVLYVRGHI